MTAIQSGPRLNKASSKTALTSNIREWRFVAGVEIESLGSNPLVGGSRLLLQSGQHDLDTVLDGWSANRTLLPELEPDVVLTQPQPRHRTPPAWMKFCTLFGDRRR